MGLSMGDGLLVKLVTLNEAVMVLFDAFGLIIRILGRITFRILRYL